MPKGRGGDIISKMQALFTIGVFGIIFDEQKRVLLAHRTDYDLWNLPGGRLEANESPWDGVIREIKEETGFDAEVIKIAGVSFKPEKNNVLFYVELSVGKLHRADNQTRWNILKLKRYQPIQLSSKWRELKTFYKIQAKLF